MTETFRPSPEVQKRTDREENSRSETLALEVLKLAVDHHRQMNVVNAREVADTAEMFWLWLTSEGSASGTTWPVPKGHPSAENGDAP